MGAYLSVLDGFNGLVDFLFGMTRHGPPLLINKFGKKKLKKKRTPQSKDLGRSEPSLIDWPTYMIGRDVYVRAARTECYKTSEVEGYIHCKARKLAPETCISPALICE
jgi:hypothetical protein